MEPGYPDRGPGPERGLPMERGRSSMDRGRGSMERGRGSVERGRGSMERGRGSMDRGMSPRENMIDRGGRPLLDRPGPPIDHPGPPRMDRQGPPMDHGGMPSRGGPAADRVPHGDPRNRGRGPPVPEEASADPAVEQDQEKVICLQFSFYFQRR